MKNNLQTRQTYYPYGEWRTTQGSTLPTDYLFTGQRYDGADLMDYGARQYEMVHGQFLQPDSIIPNVMDPQSWNRYAYVLNNPVRYTDPTGHMVKDEDDSGGGSDDTEHASEEDQYTITPENADNYWNPAVTRNNQEAERRPCCPSCWRDDEAKQGVEIPADYYKQTEDPEPSRPDKPAGGPPNTSGSNKNSPTCACNVYAPHIPGCPG